MRHPLLSLLAPLGVLFLSGLPAAGQGLTPTHTFETPLGFTSFSGEVIFATMIAPPAGETILGAELHITWTTDGTQSAALFGMHLTAPLESGKSPQWDITGADMGWGSAAGTYSAVVSTDLLNGTLVGGPFGFPPTLDLGLEAAGGGGLWGTMGPGSKIVFELGPSVTADVPAISLATGGTQQLVLNAGPTVGPGLFYLVAGTSSGTGPGLDLGGVHVPLNVDPYTQMSLAGANGPLFTNTLGVLDAQGKGSAMLNIPAGTNPSLAGLTLHHSMVVADPSTGTVLSASAAVPLLLAP